MARPLEKELLSAGDVAELMGVSGESLFGLYSEEGTSAFRAMAYEGLRSERGLAVW
jgi:hypothetical protein